MNKFIFLAMTVAAGLSAPAFAQDQQLEAHEKRVYDYYKSLPVGTVFKATNAGYGADFERLPVGFIIRDHKKNVSAKCDDVSIVKDWFRNTPGNIKNPKNKPVIYCSNGLNFIYIRPINMVSANVYYWYRTYKKKVDVVADKEDLMLNFVKVTPDRRLK